MLHLFIILSLAMPLIWLTGRTAADRGRDVKTWYWMGALSGPFALLAVYLLPRREGTSPSTGK